MFNKKLFKELIRKAMGERNASEYSKDSGVNRTYISKYLNERLDSPPSPQVLKRFADSSRNQVSYDEFMEAAGFLHGSTKEEMSVSKVDLSKKEQIVDELIQVLVDTGELKPNEKLSPQKRERLFKMIKKAIELSKL